MDVRNDSSSSNGRFDERVQLNVFFGLIRTVHIHSPNLLIATDGQLEMSRCDAMHAQILGGVAGQLNHLGRQVLHDGGTAKCVYFGQCRSFNSRIDGSRCANANSTGNLLLQDAMQATNRKLESSTSATSDLLQVEHL